MMERGTGRRERAQRKRERDGESEPDKNNGSSYLGVLSPGGA